MVDYSSDQLTHFMDSNGTVWEHEHTRQFVFLNVPVGLGRIANMIQAFLEFLLSRNQRGNCLCLCFYDDNVDTLPSGLPFKALLMEP